MAISLVICSRNRRARLAVALARLPVEAMRRHKVELVLVDSASEDDTPDLMRDFVAAAGFPARALRVERKGLSLARNHGIAAAQGDVLAFTDDDCYLAADYFDRLVEAVASPAIDYGGGSILLFDESDAPVSIIEHRERSEIAPGSLLAIGTIQGANMFFRRAVFEAAGMFRPELGAGTPFPIEDIEMATRASLAGFTGVLLPELRVHHHHGRRFGTTALRETVEGYQTGAGAYYASLLAAGRIGIWRHWWEQSVQPLRAPGGRVRRGMLRRLERELRGAADFLDLLLSRDPQDRAPP